MNKINPKKVFRVIVFVCAFYFMMVAIAHQTGIRVPLLYIFYNIPSERFLELIISFLSLGWAILYMIGFQDNELNPKIQIPILFSGIAAICGLIRAKSTIASHYEIDYEIAVLTVLLFVLPETVTLQ